MIAGQKKVVRGDRGFKTTEVTLVKHRRDLEKNEYQKTGVKEEIWQVEHEGKKLFITRNCASDMFMIDPFLTEPTTK